MHRLGGNCHTQQAPKKQEAEKLPTPQESSGRKERSLEGEGGAGQEKIAVMLFNTFTFLVGRGNQTQQETKTVT